jgi:molybdopterin converting factor subunit 1
MSQPVPSQLQSSFLKIHILFFASAREAAGDISTTTIELSSNQATTKGIRQYLSELYPRLADMVLDEDNITLALNEEYVIRGQDLPLKDGDTIALIPPISGG